MDKRLDDLSKGIRLYTRGKTYEKFVEEQAWLTLDTLVEIHMFEETQYADKLREVVEKKVIDKEFFKELVEKDEVTPESKLAIEWLISSNRDKINPIFAETETGYDIWLGDYYLGGNDKYYKIRKRLPDDAYLLFDKRSMKIVENHNVTEDDIIMYIEMLDNNIDFLNGNFDEEE